MLREVLTDLGPLDPLLPVAWESADHLWARPERCWPETARWLSRSVGGLVCPSERGLTWILGSRRASILDPSLRVEVLDAREVCAALGCEPAWTHGGCARSLLGWVGVKQYPERGFALACGEHLVGYHQCLPGEYHQVEHWDLTAAYYRVLSRLPSLLVSWTGSRLLWSVTEASAWSRWRAVVDSVGGCKGLRNSLWGCALGASSGGVGYHQGKQVRLPWRPGPLRPVAQLVARTVYELCWAASGELDSAYSATDSVISTGFGPPRVWTELGLPVRLVGQGEAEVCAPGIYRVGPAGTAYYQRGSRYRETVARPESIGPEVRGWLSWAA